MCVVVAAFVPRGRRITSTLKFPNCGKYAMYPLMMTRNMNSTMWAWKWCFLCTNLGTELRNSRHKLSVFCMWAPELQDPRNWYCCWQSDSVSFLDENNSMHACSHWYRNCGSWQYVVPGYGNSIAFSFDFTGTKKQSLDSLSMMPKTQSLR